MTWRDWQGSFATDQSFAHVSVSNRLVADALKDGIAELRKDRETISRCVHAKLSRNGGH